MKRRLITAMAVPVLIILLTGCTGKGEETVSKKILKPVAVTKLSKEICPVVLHYTGIAESKDVKEYSFKIPGKIAALFVEENQLVKKGDRLAILEQEELKFSVEAAKAQMEAAKAQYDNTVKGTREEELHILALDVEKAQDQYDFIKDTCEKMKALYEQGAVAMQNLTEAELELEQAESGLEQAKKALELGEKGATDEEKEILLKQYEIAKTNYEISELYLEESVIIADCDGYVLSVAFKENEMAAAGYPVIVLGSNEYEGRIGLIEEDISKVRVGDGAVVKADDREFKGIIKAISKAPDMESRTYTVDISLDNSAGINIGSVINVDITAGYETGMLIPVKYILNDGEDFVYMMENGRARRKNIKLGRVLEDKVCVEGLSEGEWLITEGIKSIKDGYEVAAAEYTGMINY